MAREHGRIFTSIWSDPDWRKLTPRAQHLYLTLLSAPSLSYCGVADWRPKRILQLADGWTLAALEAAAAELVDRLYIVVDEDSEEVLVRSFVRNDGLMKQRHMGVSMAKAHGSVASNALRMVIVHELIRLRNDDPELKGWGSEMVKKLLDQPSVDPSTYPLGHTPVQPPVDPSVQYESRPPIQPSTQPPSTPSPSPSPTPYSNSGYVSTEGNQGEPGDLEPPPSNCFAHPNGTERPCRACGDARHTREIWDTRRAASAKSARRAEIESCEWCDEAGWRIEPTEIRDHDVPAIRCEHTPMALDEWQSLIPTEEPSHA